MQSHTEIQSRVVNICVTPPQGFWRWTALCKTIERDIDTIDLDAVVDTFFITTGHDTYLDKPVGIQTDLPWINGSFGVVVTDEDHTVTELDLERLMKRIDLRIHQLDNEPTMDEKDAYLLDYFDRWGYCDDCGGNALHHGATFRECAHFSEDGSHWEIYCHHQVTEDGYHTVETTAIRDARIARLEHGECFLEEWL